MRYNNTLLLQWDMISQMIILKNSTSCFTRVTSFYNSTLNICQTRKKSMKSCLFSARVSFSLYMKGNCNSYIISLKFSGVCVEKPFNKVKTSLQLHPGQSFGSCPKTNKSCLYCCVATNQAVKSDKTNCNSNLYAFLTNLSFFLTLLPGSLR